MPEAEANNSVLISVVSVSGKLLTLEEEPTCTVQQLKSHIEDKWKVLAASQMLLHDQSVLEDTSILGTISKTSIGQGDASLALDLTLLVHKGAIIQDLQSEEVNVCSYALRALVYLGPGDAAVVQAVIDCLSKDIDVHAVALDALSRLAERGDANALIAVTQYLQTRKRGWFARRAAAQCLLSLVAECHDGDYIQRALWGLMKDLDWRVRCVAVEILPSLSDCNEVGALTIDALGVCLGDSSRRVKDASIISLMTFAGRGKHEAIWQLVHGSLARFLEHGDSKSIERVVTSLAKIRELGNIDEEATAEAIQALQLVEASDDAQILAKSNFEAHSSSVVLESTGCAQASSWKAQGSECQGAS